MEELWVVESGVRRRAVEVTCGGCGIVFHKAKRKVRRSEGHYCSRECAQVGSQKRVELECPVCGVVFEKTPGRVRKSKTGVITCSKGCKDKATRLYQGIRAIQPAHYGNITDSTLKDLRDKYGKPTARTLIARDARYRAARDIPDVCAVCGYTTYIEVCHIRPVADFQDTATVADVNSIENLVKLCPNHHKELDLGRIQLGT